MARSSIALGCLLVGLVSCHRPQPRIEALRATNFALPVDLPRIAVRPLDPGLREGSALALVLLGEDTARHALVADEDEDALQVLDLDRGTTTRIALAGAPTSVLVLPDGRVAVALRRAATVLLLEARGHAGSAPNLRPVTALATADEPVALALTPDGGQLVVASGWGHALEAFALGSGLRTQTVSLGREPRAVTVGKDGRAWVGYAAESALEEVDLGSGSAKPVSLVVEGAQHQIFSMPSAASLHPEGEFNDVFVEKSHKRFRRDPNRLARQTYALVRRTLAGGKEEVLAPHALVSPGDSQVVSSGYGGGGGEQHEHVAFAVARAGGGKPVQHETEKGCRLPRAATLDPKGLLLVACAGEDAVVGYAVGTTMVETLRLVVPGGPMAIAVDPKRGEVVTLAAFDRKVHVHSSDGERLAVLDLLHVPGLGLSAEAAEGRRIFHSATEQQISSDGRACASCHPDGRDDGLTWPTPRGPRQTIFLAGRLARQAPYGWDAEHASLPAHVTVTMKNLGGEGLAPRRLDALAAWLREIPAPSRRRVKGKLEADGAAIFSSSKAGCAGCHTVETELTDGAAHEVGSKTFADEKPEFLAPSLRFVGGSAPYFHDGRYRTLGELLRASDGKMGTTGHLGQGELAALEAYLRSL